MRKQHYLGFGFVTVALVSVLAGAVALLPAHAAVCEYPLFIQQGAVDANVMFLFDNSGSMNEAMMHDAYDENINYSGGLNRTTEYTVSTDGTRSPRSFKSGLPNTPTAYFVNSDQGEAGVYIGNYLNWIFYHATAAQRAAIPQFTRVQVAKAAVNDIITNMSSNIRYGVYKFNGDNGGTLVADIGTAPATIISRVNSIRADSWTPLGETMADIADDFQSKSSWIQYPCQRSFVIVVTDGLPTMDKNVPARYIDNTESAGTCASLGAPYPESYDCREYMDDVAKWLRLHDLRSDLAGKQYANTYTVGMNIDAPILAETAVDGDGAYFSASNAAELSASLQNVLRDILNRISSGSAVAIVSTEAQGDDFLYRGSFLPNAWTGTLEAFVLPYETGDTPYWEAGRIMSDAGPTGRTIFTSIGGVRRDFTTANAGTLKVPMGIASTSTASQVINWTRGAMVTGYRDRQGAILADIVESAPVTVGKPTAFNLFGNYLAFRAAHQGRERAIYVGANDGMLHAFLAATGEELWSYIPNAKLNYLDDMAATNYCHGYSVNGTPRVVDCYLNGSWKTVLVGGLKQGGGAYFALDVTDPHNPLFMWENNIAQVTESWAQVEVARIKYLDKTVGFVGSGLDETTGRAYLVAFDMATGAVISTDLLSTISGGANMATTCTAIDLDFNGYDDVMYLGDMSGKLYRVDLDGTSITRSLLFQTSANQAIQAPPVVTVDYNNKVFVYFGTGKYTASTDFTTTYNQTFYCVVDDHGGTTVPRSQLVNQTSAINPVEGFRGWLIDLEETDRERVVESSALVGGIVYFTSITPSSDLCTSGGTSLLYSAKFRNGAGFDDDDDDSNDTANDRIRDLGEGIGSRPVIDLANQKVIIQGSDTRIHIEDTLGQIRLLTVRSWQQRY